MMERQMTFNPKYQITAQIIRDLARIEVVKQSFETKAISPQLLHSLRETSKISSVHYSTFIEGNRLTWSEVQNTLKGNKLEKKERDEAEVKAYYNAWNKMEELALQNHPFNKELIEILHSLVEGSKKKIPYREQPNAVLDRDTGRIIYLPPEYMEVPQMMKDLCEWVQKSKDLPIPLVASIVHYQFVTIHPYMDGNGRTARLLTSFIMRTNGYDLKGIYSLEEYYAKDLESYYNALQTHPHHNYYYGRHEADITSWIGYFIKGVAHSFDRVNNQAITQENKGFSTDKSPLIRELDIKQRKVLELFVEFKEITANQIAIKLGVSDQSARVLIRSWVNEGFIIPTNTSNKARKYTLSNKFEELI